MAGSGKKSIDFCVVCVPCLVRRLLPPSFFLASFECWFPSLVVTSVCGIDDYCDGSKRGLLRRQRAELEGSPPPLRVYEAEGFCFSLSKKSSISMLCLMCEIKHSLCGCMCEIECCVRLLRGFTVKCECSCFARSL